jgi:predicted O-methyltransferase YrrM
MTSEEEQQFQQHIQGIAKILYRHTPPEQLQTLEGIEQAVREQMQRHVMPEVGIFLSRLAQELSKGIPGK